MRNLLLGSQSPRRSELLAALGFEFQTVRIECEETYPQNLEVSKIAEYLAIEKSKHFSELKSSELLLTCDTIVALGQQVLGKPKDATQAMEMLLKLSDKTHTVYTGVCLRTFEETLSFTQSAQVEFEALATSEIDFYIANFKPFDKAGSYGIQEWIGMAKIKSLTGSFYTIMGLPTHRVYQELVSQGLSPKF
ncbi:Maf family protein [Chryseobacterium sp. A301]